LGCGSFLYGQWFHGRIYERRCDLSYERRCDLSPDGSLLIYRAVKYGPLPPGYVQGVDSWTAIGKPPYFTALIF
jgi:hypothetical protein